MSVEELPNIAVVSVLVFEEILPQIAAVSVLVFIVVGPLLLLKKLRKSRLLREEKAKDKVKQLQQLVEAENLTNAEKILLEILESSRESAFVLKRFLFAAKVTAAILLIGLAINLIVALNN
ncbi:MAG: hypothetical protein CMP14_01115 [Rickettsiales bacterium]|nr:hypothetical protein [Rickettsiales bacterium]|tara:strand:- start:313 stop:675 length:363 start_codon:yes stop_codon:yes gene_type:complete